MLKDADRKGVLAIAKEMGELSAKAREGKLGPADMQGGCFSISSLGGIGGTAFTPIINAPEVAILGVSKSATKPVWDGNAFVPRLMLPLSLSYDHRVIDGAAAARFTTLSREPASPTCGARAPGHTRMAAAGLLALLDDIATILDDVAILTKAATRKTAGVLGDDLALNAQQVTGVRAERELPVVWAVAKGSFVNKAILVPAALLDQRRRAVGHHAAAHGGRRVPLLRRLREDRAPLPAFEGGARRRPRGADQGRLRRRTSTSSRSSARRSRARSAPTSSCPRRSS